MSNSLKDFIRQVRDCRTTAEERAIVAKECAMIRTSLKENSNNHSFRKMAKLLFIHMMGYPISFGQMECLRLIASNNFEEKRIGYLAIHQLMKEDDEILMLVTNSIKTDLNHSNQYVNMLGLTALANIGSSQMVQMLAHEVEELCFSPNVSIKRKAVVCALRIIKKVEDLNERFIAILPTLMHDQDQGVVMVTSSIISTLAHQDKTLVAPLKSQILSYLVLRLKTLVSTTGYANTSETEIGGVVNPFLQVKLLQTILELLKIASPHSSCDTEITNLITQIIVITNSSRNPGCSILLECIRIISTLPYNKNLFDVCGNVFGKLLQHKESNIRYVGLCCVYQLVKQYPEVFQSHTSIIMDCLKDCDPSIQRQALKIIYETMNTTTLRLYLNELIKLYSRKPLGILTFEDRELYSDLACKMVMSILQFSSTKRYALDALLYLLSELKDLQFLKTETILIELISMTPQLQRYATIQLFLLSKERFSKKALLRVCLWCLGEYGDLVISSSTTALESMSISSNEIESKISI
ncbi:AP-1 complex subunit gamma-like isoform X2 [Hylaeus volcanicus]|uniref:AP-1 complex subunit gamma-like isoform X2 n=1 Tax=Hylaeus volcanicus TaxID=313075 RepID=UPI0023B7B344|nr:AP-1 complex subunit gamma-like isoform X2 [Hylaeus volcanicus]